MVINKNSWHYKLWRWSFTSALNVPDKIDLCRYCHRLFWAGIGVLCLTMVALMCLLATVVLFGTIGIAAYHHPMTTIEVMVGLAACVLGIVFYVRWFNGDSNQKGLLGEWWTSRKEKICPLIQFKD